MTPHPGSLSTALRRCAAVAGDAVAFASVDGPTMTYAQWNGRADALAGLLRARVEAGGTVIARLTDRSDITFAVALFGAVRAGCFVLPLSGSFTDDGVARAAAAHAVRLVLADHDTAVDSVRIDDLPYGGPAGDGRPPGGAVTFTAGRTGAPAAVRWTHADLLTWLTGWTGVPQHRPHLHSFRWDSSDGIGRVVRTLLRYPGLRAPLAEPDLLPAVIGRFRPVDVVLLAPDAESLAGGTVESLSRETADNVLGVYMTSGVTTGATVEALRRTFRRAGVNNVYSVTEAGRGQTWMTHPPLGDAKSPAVPPAGPTPIGTGIFGTSVRIADDTGVSLPAGTAGQIWVRPGLPHTLTYCPPDAREGVFLDGWVRTGDLGLLDGTGCLYFVGRAPATGVG